MDRRDGRVLEKPSQSWRFAKAGGGDIGGSEALLADDQIYSFGARDVFAMDGVTGKMGFAWFVGQQMVVDRDSAYIATGADIRRLDRRKHAEASRQRDPSIEKSMPFSKHRSLAKRKKGEDQRRRPSTALEGVRRVGKVGVVWNAVRPESATLIGAGDVLFVGGRDSVAALDTASGKELWLHGVEGNARGLAAAADCLWVSTSAGKIYCFGAAEGNPAAAAVAANAELLILPIGHPGLRGRSQGNPATRASAAATAWSLAAGAAVWPTSLPARAN